MIKNHWGKQAKQWSYIGAHLKPNLQDVEIFENLLQSNISKASSRRPLNSVLLGVTPEIVNMNWPSKTKLLAFELKSEMIEYVWKANQTIDSYAINGDWFKFSLANGWADIIIGDGCFTFFSYPNHWNQISNSLASTLSQNGLLILRLFTRNEKSESLDNIFQDLALGNIGSFHALKWRIAMSLQTSLVDGIKVKDVWKTLIEHCGSYEQLARTTSWPLNEIKTIDAYKDSDASYYYPTINEARKLMEKNFEEISLTQANYELSENCPIFLFRKR